MTPKWARAWFGLTALCVVLGVVIGLVLSWQGQPLTAAGTGEQIGRFGGSPLNRALNNFAFFTIQSNLIVGGTCLLLAVDPNRSSTVFGVFRLIGLVAITVTGIVYHVALGGLLELDSWALASDLLVHTVVPVLAVLGWLVFGPRGLTSVSIAWWTVLYPLCYMAFTVIRGPLASDWYPYPFADVRALGYLRVVVNGLWIGLLFIGIAALATFVDGRLRSGGPRVTAASVE